MNDQIRLNIGCGNKILPDYINVDVASRNGKQPDVESDIRDLPFHENYADELMAVHVVEHFYAWEIDAVINEWKRVIKPGGKIILECPDLMKACWHYLDALSKGEEPHNQLTMWPFYGDPAHKDPLMCHKWGYTTATLIQKLEELGFTEVRSEPAQYHMGEARDMRVEGVKP